MTRYKKPAFLFLSQSFLSQLFFMIVFTVNLLYHVQIVGMNALQLVIIGTVLELTIFLCEIPTGLIADYKGRKFSIILGYLLIGLGFLIEGLFPLFSTVLVAQVIWGIGYTCISGALQAWVTDEVGANRVDKIFINGTKFENIGSFIGIPLAITIGAVSLQASILIGAIGFFILAIFLSIFMKETKHKKQRKDTTSTSPKSILSSALSAFRHTIILRYVLVIAFIGGIYSEGFDRLWITHLSTYINHTFSTQENLIFIVGGLRFVTSVFTIIILHLLNRISKKLSLKNLYYTLFINHALLVLALLGFAFSINLYVLMFFLIAVQVIRHVSSTFETLWFNRLITDSSKRATFFSIKGQVDALGQIGGGPVTGMISLLFPVKIALAASALLLTPVLYIFRRLVNMTN